MAYQIAKGWPAQAAIDEIVKAATGVELTPGQIALINTDGDAIIANYESADAGNIGLSACFLIDFGAVKEGEFVGLFSECVITVDADHYQAETYAAGDNLTARAGKFDKRAASEDDRTTLARVLKAPGTDGVMRVLWLGAN